MRRIKSGGDLTNFSEKPVRHRIGRPTVLSDDQLHGKREKLVQIFEGIWDEIGWELLTCKKAEELIRIFNIRLGTFVANALSVFCRQSAEPPSGTTLRKVRAEWRAIIEPKRRAEEAKLQAQEKLQRADCALALAQKDERGMVEQEREKRQKEFEQAKQAADALHERERELEGRLEGLEASFARQQLFRFLKSKRYDLKPLNLANAAAGLPYTGWRQSMRRCIATPRVVQEGLDYQIFKAIRYLAGGASKRTENALVLSFRERIPSLPIRYQLPRKKLAEKWFFLERAIRQAYRTKPHPKKLPFVITKQYFMQIRSQSEVERVLADQAKLRLSERHFGNASASG